MVSPQKFDPNAPLQEGEFRRIKGIAVTTEQALHDAGIETFDHLAMLTPEEIAGALRGQVGIKERAARQDWIGQAAKYARQMAESRQPVGNTGEAEEIGDRQHYASFMVVLLLDEDQHVRRTTVTHVQGDTRENWAGWEPQRITNWIAEEAGIPGSAPIASPVKAVKPGRVEKQAIKALKGSLSFGPVQLLGAGSKRPRSVVTSGNPFSVGLNLDLSQVEAPAEMPLYYQATAQCHGLRQRGKSYTVQTEGEAQTGGMNMLMFPFSGLPEGIYHLDVAVMVAPENALNPAEEGLCALTEGMLVRVQAEETAPMLE